HAGRRVHDGARPAGGRLQPEGDRQDPGRTRRRARWRGAPAGLSRGVPDDRQTRVGRILSSPVTPMLLAFPALLLGAGLALWLQPVPHSDWGYYWNAAGSFSKYERGGVGLWLLAIPKTLGLSPVVSALCLNLPAAAIALWISWRADDGGVRGLWLACAAYLVLIAPYFGIVQLDLVAATSLGVGAWLAATSDTYARPNASLLPAVVLVAVGVSTKPQFALTLWAMAALLVLPWLSWRARAGRGMSRLLLILFA